MKDWKKELERIESGEGTYRQHLSKYEQLEWLIETLLQEEREKARREVVEDMMKRCRLTQTYNFLRNYKQNHLSKKGEKKWGNL